MLLVHKYNQVNMYATEYTLGQYSGLDNTLTLVEINFHQVRAIHKHSLGRLKSFSIIKQQSGARSLTAPFAVSLLVDRPPLPGQML